MGGREGGKKERRNEKRKWGVEERGNGVGKFSSVVMESDGEWMR